jgi:site-specific DNA recombinase
MLRAVIYARVSTNVQEDNYSFSTQLETCRSYAQQQGMSIVAEFQEVESGGTLYRQELDKARTLIRSGIANVLLVYNVDRLSRNLADMLHLREELRSNNATLHYAIRGAASLSAEGGLFDNIEAAFAEYERMRIKKRLLEGREGKVRGTADKPPQVYGNGNCPYGYRYVGRKKNRRLVIDDIEAIVVRNLYLRSLTGTSVVAIARQLNEQEVPTPAQAGRTAGSAKREKPIWTGPMVWRILTNEVYAGTMYFNKTHRIGTRDVRMPREQWIPVPVPAIVDRDIFDAVQERLHSNCHGSKRNAKHFYLLGRGKLKCQCSYTMTGSIHNGWRSYRCHHYSGMEVHPCTLGEVKADTIEQIVWEWLYSVLTPTTIKAGIEAQEQMTANERATIDQRLAALQKRQKELDREAEKMIAAFKADIISMDELAKDKAVVDAERRSLEAEYRRLEDLGDTAAWYDAGALMAEAEELRAYMPFMNDEEKAGLLDRVYLKALRKTNAEGKQVVKVECRLGSTTLSLPITLKSSPPTTTPPDMTPPDNDDIGSQAHSSPRSPGCARCQLPRSRR